MRSAARIDMTKGSVMRKVLAFALPICAGNVLQQLNVAITSLSSAATAFSGQNLGAKNYVYLRKGGIQIPLASGLITCTAGIAVTVCCRPILGLFTQHAAVLDYAVRYIRIVLPGMLPADSVAWNAAYSAYKKPYLLSGTG